MISFGEVRVKEIILKPKRYEITGCRLEDSYAVQ